MAHETGNWQIPAPTPPFQALTCYLFRFLRGPLKALPAFLARLDQSQVKYGAWKGDSKQPTLRPNGVKQAYLQAPDNFWLEVNDNPF